MKDFLRKNDCIMLDKILDDLDDELKTLNSIIVELIKIDGQYKKHFVNLKYISQCHLKSCKSLPVNSCVKQVINLLEQFGSVFEMLANDESLSDEYLNTGMLHQLADLRSRIEEKIVHISQMDESASC